MAQPELILREIINTQYFAVLNSVGEGQPYSNLVSFAVNDDLKSLCFVTSRNTRKYRNIIDNHNISLLIDNRNNRPSDIKQATAVTVIGKASEDLRNKSSLQEVFLNRHPQLKEFIEDSNNALILVKVSEYIIAGFDNLERVVISK